MNNKKPMPLMPQDLAVNGATIELMELEFQDRTGKFRAEFLITSSNQPVEELAAKLTSYFDSNVIELPRLGLATKAGPGEIHYGGEADTVGQLQATVNIYFQRLATPPTDLIGLGDRPAQGRLLEGR